VQAPPSSPIIVRVVEPSELSGLSDVIIGSVGLTGAITLAALGFGMVLASLIIGYRKFRARSESEEDAAQTQQLGLTPTDQKHPIARS
jgi:hypothetical protein